MMDGTNTSRGINPKVTAATGGAAVGGGLGGAVAVVVLYLIDPSGTLPEQVSSALTYIISFMVSGLSGALGAFLAGYLKSA